MISTMCYVFLTTCLVISSDLHPVDAQKPSARLEKCFDALCVSTFTFMHSAWRQYFAWPRWKLAQTSHVEMKSS